MQSVFLVLLALSAAHAVTVTYSGYITDVLCYDKCIVADSSCSKCALDNTNVLTAPREHTLHCIRDVQACIDSGFFLTFNVGTATDPDYRVRFRLDSRGNDLAVNVIDASSHHDGLQVTVVGETDDDINLRATSIVQCTPAGLNNCDGYCVGCTSNSTLPLKTIGPVTHDLVLAHGIMLIIAWIFIAPIAFLIKRNPTTIPSLRLSHKPFGGKFPLAFLLHGGLMSTSVILTVIAVIIALVDFDRRNMWGHGIIGLIIFVLAIWQPLPAIFCRPDHSSPRRKWFNLVHRGGGFTLIPLGFVNVLLGCANYQFLWDNCRGPTLFAVVFVGLGLFIISFLVLECLRRRNNGLARSSSAVGPK